MDSLHHVIRAMRGESRPRSDHLAVFREFLAHLDRVAANAAKDVAKRTRVVSETKPNGKQP